jgi:hypothetical protein
MIKYIFNNSYSGKLAREKLFKTNWLSKINWRMLSRCFIDALAVIGVTLLVWVGVVGYLIAMGGSNLIIK